MGRCNVVSICSGTGTCQFAVNFGSPCKGMIQVFKNQCSGTFTNNKTVSVFIVRPAGSFGIVVSFTQRFHGIESAYSGLRDNAFRSPCKNNIGFSQPDQVVGLHNTVGGRSTGTYHREVGTSETMAHGDMAGGDIQNHFWNKERVKPRSSVAQGKVGHLFGKGNQPSDTGSKYHSHPVFVNMIPLNTGIFHSLVTYYQGSL